MKIQDAIVKLSYATNDQVMAAIAEFHNLQFVNLKDLTIPQAVVEPDFEQTQFDTGRHRLQ